MLNESKKPTASVYPIDDKTFSVYVTHDQKLDSIEDTRDIIRRYKEYLTKNGAKQNRKSLFETRLINDKRFSKEVIERYAEKIFYYYPNLCSSRLASFIPEYEPHLLEDLLKEDKNFSVELKIHNYYFKSDRSEALSLSEIKKLPKKERTRWYTEKCAYIEHDDCLKDKLVVAVDAVYLLINLIHPIFLENKRKGFDPFLDFAYDISHEIEHFSRKPHINEIRKLDEEYEDKIPELKKRDFYVDYLLRTVVEEGICNYAVYSRDPFYFSPKIIQRFRKKFKNILTVENIDDYFEKSLYIESYEGDHAGVYYAGEASCYLVGLLLEKELNKKLINIKYKNKEIEPEDISKILESGNLNKNYVLFSSNLDEYLITYKHIHNLGYNDFLIRLEEAQKMLNLRDEHKIFVRDEINELEYKAKKIPWVK